MDHSISSTILTYLSRYEQTYQVPPVSFNNIAGNKSTTNNIKGASIF